MASKRVLVVGGVAGGAACAARLRRLDEKAEVFVYERGPDISFANCGLPYYVGEVIKDKAQLVVQTPESMKQRYKALSRLWSVLFATLPLVTYMGRKLYEMT